MKLAPIPENDDYRIADLISLNMSESSKKDMFDKIIMILSECLKVPIAYVSTIETSKQKIHASCGLGFNSSDRSTSFCSHTVLQKEPLIVEDTLKDDRFFDNPMVIGKPKIRFYAGFPLISLSGNGIGALCISDTVPRTLSKKELIIFKTIGDLLNGRLKMYKLGNIQDQIMTSQKSLTKVNKKLNKRNKFYKQLFGQYMSESLLNSILENKEATQLGGEKRFVTVLMSDLRGFSSMSEKHEPEVVVDILNTYLETMIDIIQKHDGFINEILGDGILVVFGAPNHVGNCAAKAVECAKEMQFGITSVNQILKNKNLPELEMGIGINSGELIAGNIGSKKRMKYGVVGETVNIVSRIEALTIAGQILISEATYDKVKDTIKSIGQLRVKVKGLSHHLTIYDISNNLI